MGCERVSLGAHWDSTGEVRLPLGAHWPTAWVCVEGSKAGGRVEVGGWVGGWFTYSTPST